MVINATLSVAAGVVFMLAFSPYIWAIVRKETSPRKSTWLIWMAGDLIVLAGMIAKGTVSGQLVAAVLGATSVFLLSLKYGEPGWTRLDKVCIILAGLAIVLWQYFGESNVGISLSLAALAIAAWPTYVSAWHKPENENRRAWILFELSSLLAVLAVVGWDVPGDYRFANVAPPVAFLLIDSVMIYILFVRPCLKKANRIQIAE